MPIKTFPLSHVEKNLKKTLTECAESGQTVVVEMPDGRLLAIQPLDPQEDDERGDLWSTDEDQRRFAIIEASRTADRSALPRLLELLDADSYANRRHVVRALGRIGGAAVEARLLHMLEVEEGLILGDVAQSLGRLACAAAVEPLRRLGPHELEWVRQNVRWALQQLGTPGLITAVADRAGPRRFRLCKGGESARDTAKKQRLIINPRSSITEKRLY
jgi:hypothetical protein